MPNKSSRPDKPGRLFIDCYMPNATPDDQKAAYEKYSFADTNTIPD